MTEQSVRTVEVFVVCTYEVRTNSTSSQRPKHVVK